MSAPRAVLLAHFAGYLLQFRSPLILELVRRGYQTHVVVPGVTPAIDAGVRALGATAHELPLQRTGLNPFADLATRRALDATLRELAPEVVIATGVKPIVHGMPAAQRAGARIRCPLFAGLGAVGRPAGARQRLISALTTPMLRRAIAASTHVAVQNADDAALLRERFGGALPGEPIETAGTGVDLSHFAVAPPPAAPQVLMMARLVREKGIYEFLEAARIVRARVPQVRFVLAGFFETRAGAASKDEFLAQCREAGVHHAGHLEDVRPLLAESSLFVLPTYYGEGRPRSIQEALAMGRPIVTTDGVGCRDAIDDGVHGRIVPPRDGARLAAAILEVLSWPDPAAVAERCRALAERRYCARAIAARFLDDLGATARAAASESTR
ncbi:MAG: glycosyltransferase family 4 protein [Phycisphaerales bacterium]